MRKKRPLEREVKHVRDANLIVIASEDHYAVQQYFDFFESTRIKFHVLKTLDGKSAPEHVLERLKEYIATFDIGEGDTFWLVCDCDHWVKPDHVKNLTLVLRECRKNRIKVALSKPCFELWLLLHFADFPENKMLTCAEVETLLRAAAGGYDKTKVYNLRIDHEKVLNAVKRAADHFQPRMEIPTQLQTAIHRIIRSLIAGRVISVPHVRDEASEKKIKKPKDGKK